MSTCVMCKEKSFGDFRPLAWIFVQNLDKIIFIVRLCLCNSPVVCEWYAEMIRCSLSASECNSVDTEFTNPRL